jgi:hypothetical protein
MCTTKRVFKSKVFLLWTTYSRILFYMQVDNLSDYSLIHSLNVTMNIVRFMSTILLFVFYASCIFLFLCSCYCFLLRYVFSNVTFTFLS